MISIDGSAGEGGGQVLRSALTLAVITGQPMEVHHIRAGRSNPGLQPQHLAAVQAAAAICAAQVDGGALGSDTLRFVPGGPARPGDYACDVAEIAGRGSAGAVGLVLQTVLLPLALADGESRLTLRGGTHVPWAPSADYLQGVFLPTVAQAGIVAQVELRRWGFYPAGQGEIHVRIAGRPAPLCPLTLTGRGRLRRVTGRGVVTELPAHIPQRMVNRARNLLGEAGLPADLEPVRARGAGPGAGIFLCAEYEGVSAGFTAYGRLGLPADQVAQAAVEELLAHHRSGAPVDPYLADQLVLPLALAAGRSQVTTSRITPHLLTNLAVVQAFLPIEARIEGSVGGPGTLVITGVPVQPRNHDGALGSALSANQEKGLHL